MCEGQNQLTPDKVKKQEEIREQKEAILGEIADAQTALLVGQAKLTGLQKRCRHPRLLASQVGYCPDCEWWDL